MKPSTERKVLRGIHLIASAPIIGFIYGPVAEIPEAVIVIRYILLPLVAISGLWMWKSNWIRKFLNS